MSCEHDQPVIPKLRFYPPLDEILRSRKKYTHLKSADFNNTEALVLNKYFVYRKMCARACVTCGDTQAGSCRLCYEKNNIAAPKRNKK